MIVNTNSFIVSLQSPYGGILTVLQSRKNTFPLKYWKDVWLLNVFRDLARFGLYGFPSSDRGWGFLSFHSKLPHPSPILPKRHKTQCCYHYVNSTSKRQITQRSTWSLYVIRPQEPLHTRGPNCIFFFYKVARRKIHRMCYEFATPFGFYKTLDVD